jgi:hypothetical protein
MGRLGDILRSPFSFLFAHSSQEDRVATYVCREHERGRNLADILDDAYVKNRVTPQQAQRLLDRPEIVHAIGRDAIEEARRTSARDLAHDHRLQLVHLEPVEHAALHGLDQVARLDLRLLAGVAADKARALEDDVVELARVRLVRADRADERARPEPLAAQHRVG